VVRTAAEQRLYEEAIVADLRSSSGRYPGDPGLTELITELLEASSRFRGRWEARSVGVYEQEHKTIDHPELGLLEVDCDILTTHRNDLRVVVYTAVPGSAPAKALDELSASLTGRTLMGVPHCDSGV
jgi:hypothetical protein